MAAQFGVDFLGSLELDPSIRKGGDRGMPVSLAGPESDVGGGFFRVAEKVVLAAERVAAQGGGVLEIE